MNFKERKAARIAEQQAGGYIYEVVAVGEKLASFKSKHDAMIFAYKPINILGDTRATASVKNVHTSAGEINVIRQSASGRSKVFRASDAGSIVWDYDGCTSLKDICSNLAGGDR